MKSCIHEGICPNYLIGQKLLRPASRGKPCHIAECESRSATFPTEEINQALKDLGKFVRLNCVTFQDKWDEFNDKLDAVRKAAGIPLEEKK